MTLELQDMLKNEAVFDVSFFNFENSITAAYFADRNLNIIRANKNFKALFPDVEKFEGLNMLFLLDKLGLSQDRIDEYSTTLTKKTKVQIPDLKITVQGKVKTYSLLSTYTKNNSFSYLNGVQGQLIDRTAEYELHAQNQELLEKNKESNILLTEKAKSLKPSPTGWPNTCHLKSTKASFQIRLLTAKHIREKTSLCFSRISQVLQICPIRLNLSA